MAGKRLQLARARKAVGFSQEELAEQLGVDRTTIGRWEAGQTEPQPWQRPRVAEALKIPLAQLEALLADSNAPAEGIDVPSERSLELFADRADSLSLGEEEEMERRQLLRSLSVLGAATFQGQAVATIRNAFESSLLADGHDNSSDDWQEIAEEYAQTYLATSPDTLLNDLAVDLLSLRRDIERKESSSSRSDLYSAGATLAAIMAMTANNLGLSRESRHWWRSARRAADASHNRSVRVWVNGYESMSGLYQNRPTKIVLDRAESAIHIAGGSVTPGKMEALACKAQILSRIGDDNEARAVLRQMRDAFERLPSELAAERSSLLTWPVHSLLHSESFVYTVMGDAEDAAKSQVAALKVYPASMPRERTLVELHQAARIVRAGDVDAGIGHAESVLDSLPIEHHTKLIRVVSGIVLNSVPESEFRKPSVGTFRERLASQGRQEV